MRRASSRDHDGDENDQWLKKHYSIRATKQFHRSRLIGPLLLEVIHISNAFLCLKITEPIVFKGN